VEIILYAKGPVLLDKLATRIGRDRFKVLCRDMVIERDSSTVQLLERIRLGIDDETAKWFEDELKSF